MHSASSAAPDARLAGRHRHRRYRRRPRSPHQRSPARAASAASLPCPCPPASQPASLAAPASWSSHIGRVLLLARALRHRRCTSLTAGAAWPARVLPQASAMSGDNPTAHAGSERAQCFLLCADGWKRLWVTEGQLIAVRPSAKVRLSFLNTQPCPLTSHSHCPCRPLPYPSATLRFVRRIKLEGALAVMDYLAVRREKVQEPRAEEWRRWGSVTMTNPPPQLAHSCTFRASGGGIAEDVA